MPCSCVDCEGACPKPPVDPPKPAPLNILGLDAYAFTMLVIFLIGSMLYLMGECLFSARRGKCERMRDIGRMQIGFGMGVHTGVFFFGMDLQSTFINTVERFFNFGLGFVLIFQVVVLAVVPGMSVCRFLRWNAPFF